ncbi:MAG: hypothetical protein L0177_09985, partial [Chloroflexi bacterium]|nr:hypothetical protein [Chloroflexota bacterium]
MDRPISAYNYRKILLDWRAVILLTLLVALTTTFAVRCGGADDGDLDLTPTETAVPASQSTPAPTATPAPPANATARAGADRDVQRGAPVALNGSASSDPDNEPLSYTWTQVYGPDVTGGVGFLSGATPNFTAPQSVTTLIFELRVSDGHGDSAPDAIQLNVMEHTDTAFFVDGDAGSDETGDGSRDNPFASISHALRSIQGPDYDIYVKTRARGAAYVEAETLRPQSSISLYGGYGPGWIRDVANSKTKLDGASVAVEFNAVTDDAWLSGFEISASSADEDGESVIGVNVARGTATLYIEDNVIVAGNAGNGAAARAAGSSYGVLVGDIENVVVRRNVITAGNGGAGATGNKG